MIEQTCNKNVGTWSPVACGKPAKDIGPLSNNPRCGIHLAAEKRRVANQQARQERSRLEREHWQETNAIQAALSHRCGAAVRLSRDRGTVSMSLDDFERLFPAPEGGAQ